VRFVDECSFRVEAGAGGNGCVAFRRESLVPFGGPSGGDGGDGGSVVFVGDEGKNSLLDLKHQKAIRAERGEHGMGSDCYGRRGKDALVRVPVGTIVKDEATGELIGELLAHAQELVVAQGGKGGRGNKHFATPTERAPRRAEPGTAGVVRDVALELRVMADVGLLGFPNVGKSTFISVVSQARPKIADYPFTTLVPQLGVVELERWLGAEPGETLVLADIPGLVPGASDGAGLGSRFLRHVKRSRALLHLVTADLATQDAEDSREPLRDYDALRSELERFDPELAGLPEVIALSKCDLPEVAERYEELAAAFEARGKRLLRLSAPTRAGVAEVLEALRTALASAPRDQGA
jgi:GTP-binding protein